MKSVNFYKVVAIFCFVTLSLVQCYLVYNTYEFREKQYFISEKDRLDRQYSQSIRNDKVYPGGQKIIDSFIYRNMDALEYNYRHQTKSFNVLRHSVCDSIFTTLRARSNMDSLFQSFINKDHLNKDLRYLLTISNIGVMFEPDKYITLFRSNGTDSYSSHKLLGPAGISIAGNLKHPDKQNEVTHLTVSVSTAHSYQIVFALYVDTPNRNMIIFKQMLPVLLLSTFSVLLMALLYFYTYRNWLRQKKLSEMQSDFVHSITHELNTPLSTIIVANRNIQTEKIANNKGKLLELTAIIERQARRLNLIFNQVMDITKMNKHDLHKEKYLMGDLLNEILLDYKLSLAGKNVQIILNNNGYNPKIDLDRFGFTTVLTNIFENAIKYNRSDQKEIVVDLNEDRESVSISIRDNGIGISKKLLTHIFDKFYRVPSGTTKEVNGLGLGLFYVIQSIEAHGWKIKVESEENSGSNFIISIPKV